MRQSSKFQSSSTPWPAILPLISILSVGFILRLVCLLFYTDAINGEGAEYARIAENLVAGKGYVGIGSEGRELIFPPLYPLLIAAGSFLTRNFYLSAQVVSLVAGVFLLLALFGIARDLYGDKVAYFATAIAALHPVLVRLSASPWVEGPYITLVMAAIYSLNRCHDLSVRRYWILSGTFLGLAYLTSPQAIIFPLLALVAFSLLYRRKMLASLSNVAIFALSFVIIALPYVVFLTVSTGQFRLEGKTIVNNEMGRLLIAGVPEKLAGFEVTRTLEAKGVWMRPHTDIANSSGTSNYGTTLKIMASKGMKNLFSVYRDFTSQFYLGAPLLFPLVVLGLFRKVWTRHRAAREVVLLLFVVGVIVPLMTMIHNFTSRYSFILIPFVILWGSKGIFELSTWGRKTSKALAIPAQPAPYVGPAITAMTCISLLAVFTAGFGRIDTFEADKSANCTAMRRAGEWLASLPGEKTVMDTDTPTAFHAKAEYVPMPWCDSETALKFAAKKKVGFIVVKGWNCKERSYLEQWLTSGPHSPDLTRIYTSGTKASERIVIYRFKKAGVSGPGTS